MFILITKENKKKLKDTLGDLSVGSIHKIMRKSQGFYYVNCGQYHQWIKANKLDENDIITIEKFPEYFL